MIKIHHPLFIVLLATLGTSGVPAQRPLHLDVYTAGEAGWRVDSTLIYGNTEAILVDTQYLRSEANKLADRVTATGTRLKAIIITHPHDDHYMGVGTLHERFPKVPIYMSAAALEDFNQKSADSLAGMKKYLQAEAPASLPVPEVFPTTHFVIDGQPVELMQGQGDEAKTSSTYLWIPSLRALVAGDMVFNGVHVWLTNSNEQSRAAWVSSLEGLASLQPEIVVAGHKRSTETSDAPESIAFTIQYIKDFEAARSSASNPEELVTTMKAKYPDLALADKILTRSAKRAFPK